MHSDVAISVKDLTKSYRVFQHPVDRIKEALTFGRRRFHTEFTALKEVSFEVKKGESLGIIGRNGSGKSSLLQLICGILKPTSGSVRVNGRVSALLELGSGFNPEFTGRENIYFQGAVLGFSKPEMAERINEIIAFADIGDFIDQPVRIYSSGMFVRLAFAVIAHVDAEILIVDEALAVGDAAFTQKCMRFLRGFMKSGTLLFVSHDTSIIQNLCGNAICLNKGKVSFSGDSKKVIEAYMQLTHQETHEHQINLIDVGTREQANKEISIERSIYEVSPSPYFQPLEQSTGWETGKAKIVSVRLLNESGQDSPTLHGGEVVRLEILAVINETINSPILGWFVKDRLGQSLFGEHTYTYVTPPLVVKPGEKIKGEFRFKLPLLPNGDYAVAVSIAEGNPVENQQHHWLHEALIISVVSDKLRYGLVGIQFDMVSLNFHE